MFFIDDLGYIRICFERYVYMKYYLERNKLLDDNFSIDFTQLTQYFAQTYIYFENKEYFNCAKKGVWITRPYQRDEEQIIPPSLAPSPEIFFINHLHSTEVYPIWEHYEYYTEEILFTVIEILYDHIAVYDYQTSELIKVEPQKEFSEHINNILRMYKGGYYLEPTYGFISHMPNDALKNLLQQDVTDMLEEGVLKQLKTAIKMYYRFDSDIEMKKKAINVLADILEPLREDLKNILNQEYNINKNDHDKLIFGIVNTFNIRHNKADQLRGYSHNIWYDWMMQYYTSVIITYFRLKKLKEI